MINQGAGDFTQEILAERYEVQQLLGKKAGRRTLLARDLQTQELVVVKLLLFGDEFEWQDLKLFEREAETLKALSHPAIPRYLNYFELNSSDIKGFALVQNYIPAESLEAQIQAGRSFSEGEVKEIAKAILEILQYLHERQPAVVHRDIKPSNILLTNRSGNSVGDVYLVDFGSVQNMVKNNNTMTVVGTYGYMPPEQLTGRVAPTADLYSLGTTLIYLVTGQHPADLPQKDLMILFEQAANISSTFSSWLRKITHPIASQRFTSANKALQILNRTQIIAAQSPKLPKKTSNIIITKPFGSKVIVNNKSDCLEIIIPQVFSFYKITVLSYWGFMLFLISSFLSVIPLINLFTPFLFSLSLLIFFGIMGICIFGEKRLCIDQRQISLCYKLWSVERYHPLPSSSKHILRLERAKDNYNQPYLIIWSGMRQYKIHTGNNYAFPVSTLELDWLAEELSNWLGLPIVRE
ncbi:MAG TPA: serine/threonine-protein kinase [Nostocaceae cyanobacterium]|nr:serine/threonine-protein kinase [Nostocaceae cyanobacterium]